eukprot:scaffold85082_cov40-Cyclotella_meneghiniana.AAC.3
MQFIMVHPNIQELVGELKNARMYIIEPPDQDTFDLAKQYLIAFHKAFRVLYYMTLKEVCPNTDIKH